jgi:N-methylhydantoinase A
MNLNGELAAAAISDKLASILNLSLEESAAGAIQVVNAAMEGAIRVALRERGDDPRDFGLVAFGGGGALHACELARSLAIPTVVVPPHPGTLCAEGLLSSDIKLDASLSDVQVSTRTDLPNTVKAHFDSLEQELLDSFTKMDNIDPADITFDRFCDVRYVGQAYEVMVPVESVSSNVVEEIVTDFHSLHHRTFGFSDPGDACELVTFRVTAKVQFGIPQPSVATGHSYEPHSSRTVYELEAGGPQTAFMYRREDLAAGTVIDGPAIIDQLDTTVWLPSYTSAVVHESGSLIVTVQPETDASFISG